MSGLLRNLLDAAIHCPEKPTLGNTLVPILDRNTRENLVSAEKTRRMLIGTSCFEQTEPGKEEKMRHPIETSEVTIGYDTVEYNPSTAFRTNSHSPR
jgi:hypothetical protein